MSIYLSLSGHYKHKPLWLQWHQFILFSAWGHKRLIFLLKLTRSCRYDTHVYIYVYININIYILNIYVYRFFCFVLFLTANSTTSSKDQETTGNNIQILCGTKQNIYDNRINRHSAPFPLTKTNALWHLLESHTASTFITACLLTSTR